MGPLGNKKAQPNSYAITPHAQKGDRSIVTPPVQIERSQSPGKVGDPGAGFIIASALRFYLLFGIES